MQASNIIIGGGLAGLLTAWHLEKKGLPYLLLEAKRQLGGRVLGAKSDTSAHYHDLGPTWVFPHQQGIQRLLDELDLPYDEQYTQGDALFQKPGTQGTTRTAGAGVMSMYRVRGGMTRLIDALYSRLNRQNIKTSHPVTHITRGDGCWVVTAQNDDERLTFEAHNLILALPPRMITQHLTPKHWASSGLINDLDQVPTWMAAQAKFVSTYASPFWRENGLSGQAFSQQGPMQEMHDACGFGVCAVADNVDVDVGTSALFGFVGVPASHRAQFTEAHIKQACLAQIEQLYGVQAAPATAVFYKDWAADKYVAAKRDISESPAHPHFALSRHQQELAQKNLYLVGSEFADTDAGYLEGAVCAVNALIDSV
ncbi:flavin monoamine oxidase family protein [Marinagarivorans algicola]|uniref:flavin monoamine oxidase family protein n=1 Tax=Marinagarivorans algicola TaxID=1513270 RepID=UPI0006B8B964|nr:FAD-dependent oxidoreductase [Marinagarivorans algicola]